MSAITQRKIRAAVYIIWMWASVALVLTPMFLEIHRPYNIAMVFTGMIWVGVEKWRTR